MRIAFAGTPGFAATILSALLAAGQNLVLVLTQPDRPAGRGMRLNPSPVKLRAVEAGIAVQQPASLRTAEAQEALRAYTPDVLVVAAYGLILPQAVLDLPQLGCINVHASLLPRWRGAAPIQRAILAGDTQTGVTIMQMDAGLDTGYMLLTKVTSISLADTAASVEARLATLGAEALLEALPLRATGALAGVPQPAEGVTYAAKIQKAEAALDFSQSATQLDRAVRAFNPAPVAFTHFRGEALRIWQTLPHDEHVPGALPGAVYFSPAGQPGVACGEGWLELVVVQRPGGKPLAAATWATGVRPQPGERFGV